MGTTTGSTKANLDDACPKRPCNHMQTDLAPSLQAPAVPPEFRPLVQPTHKVHHQKPQDRISDLRGLAPGSTKSGSSNLLPACGGQESNAHPTTRLHLNTSRNISSLFPAASAPSAGGTKTFHAGERVSDLGQLHAQGDYLQRLALHKTIGE